VLRARKTALCHDKDIYAILDNPLSTSLLTAQKLAHVYVLTFERLLEGKVIVYALTYMYNKLYMQRIVLKYLKI